VAGIIGWEETIVAMATPAGRGALALLRISGPKAFDIISRHVKPWPTKPRTASRCEIFDESGTLDDAIITLFPGPRSFTGEDVVELSTHGGQIVPDSVAAAIIRGGARAAQPGEFTRRAILNGKLDLIQAEGIGELVAARSKAMQRAALFQMHRGLSRKLSDLREEFLKLEALIAYDIDFPGEDDGPISPEDISRAIERIKRSLNDLLATASLGNVMREGASVVIAGPPNAGKSSLFNAMLGSGRAIVTEIPGTTRDALEGVIDTGEWLLRLVDTAGLRPTEDRLEKLGVEVSERYLVAADVVLACAEDPGVLKETASALTGLTDAPVIRVWTKSDLRTAGEADVAAGSDDVPVSAETRSGLPELFQRISETLKRTYGGTEEDAPVLTTARQQAAIEKALEELLGFQSSLELGEAPVPVAAVHLRAATGALEELIGGVNADDVLAKLFSTFCIGK